MTPNLENVVNGFVLDAGNRIPSLEQITALQERMSDGIRSGIFKTPEMTTEHYFSDAGMYCRKVWRPCGTLIIGKTHKRDHLFICAAGEIVAWTESGMRILKAGDVVESKKGTKRVTFAMTDAVGITVHKTNKRNFEKLEAQLIEEDDAALFDAHNQMQCLKFEEVES